MTKEEPVQKLTLEGCEECPQCKNTTLPKIKGMMTGRRCSVCGAVCGRDCIMECVIWDNKKSS